MGQLRPRWAKIALELPWHSPEIAQDGTKMFEDGPLKAKDGLDMAQDGPTCLPWAVLSFHLGPSRALPGFAFALHSLCLRFAFALPLLCLCFPNGGPLKLRAKEELKQRLFK